MPKFNDFDLDVQTVTLAINTPIRMSMDPNCSTPVHPTIEYCNLIKTEGSGCQIESSVIPTTYRNL